MPMIGGGGTTEDLAAAAFCGVTWQEMLMLVMSCYVTMLVSY